MLIFSLVISMGHNQSISILNKGLKNLLNADPRKVSHAHSRCQRRLFFFFLTNICGKNRFELRCCCWWAKLICGCRPRRPWSTTGRWSCTAGPGRACSSTTTATRWPSCPSTPTPPSTRSCGSATPPPAVRSPHAHPPAGMETETNDLRCRSRNWINVIQQVFFFSLKVMVTD